MTKHERVEFERGYPLVKPKWSDCRLGRLIMEFVASGLAKEKIDTKRYKNLLIGKCSIDSSINKYGLSNIKCVIIGNDLYLVNTLLWGIGK